MIIKKPPIVSILGHIDHGKTTLLDYIRKSNIALKEAGGITQSIGAYEIDYKGEKITFIDTPGHQAFYTLRERGINISDISILVIAADEGVKEQTKEIVNYLKNSKIPFIVALNKIDKKEADPQKVISQLIELEIMPEKWGGDVPLVEISAYTGQGVDDLLETIIILRDIYDLKVEINKKGEGYILEAFKDPKRGILASVIITEGEVKSGDILVTKSAFCKIKIFEDDLGNKLDKAYPSKPVLIGNFNNLPLVGESFKLSEEKDILKIQERLKEEENYLIKKFIFSDDQSQTDYLLIIKADNIGSLEALVSVFKKISEKNNLNLKVVKADIGPVTFEDIKLAKDLDAFLISFNLRNSKQILEEIKNLNLDKKFFESKIIYQIEEDFVNFINKKQEPESLKGELEVLAVFSQTKNKKTIGGRVIKGKLNLNQKVAIYRDQEVVGYGKIISLEKNKNPTKEINEQELGGLIIETHTEIKEADIIRSV